MLRTLASFCLKFIDLNRIFHVGTANTFVAKAPIWGGGGNYTPRAVYYTTRRIAQLDPSVNGSGVLACYLAGWNACWLTSWLCAGDGRGDAGDIANAAGGKPAAIYIAGAMSVA